jgi:hypothetical protein
MTEDPPVYFGERELDLVDSMELIDKHLVSIRRALLLACALLAALVILLALRIAGLGE